MKKIFLSLLLPLLLLSACTEREQALPPEPEPEPTPAVEEAQPVEEETLTYGNATFRTDEKELDLSAEKSDIPALIAVLSRSGAERVELGENAPTIEEAEALSAGCPGVFFRYDTEFFGQTLSTEVTEIDLSGRTFLDTEELERELIRFPFLTKVDMCDCGLDDETMAALNERHPGTEFVWMVTVRVWRVRSDATYFISYGTETVKGMPKTGFDNLRYCKNLVAVDLGHYTVKNEELEFLYSTPHIRYLILAITHVSDLTAVGSLQELEYLELFFTDFSDITPLENCPKLKHLNICHCYYLRDDCIESLCRMTQLERLWFYDHRLSRNFTPELEAALPHCEIQHFLGTIHSGATGYGWREHEAYYAMRDAFDMFYLD